MDVLNETHIPGRNIHGGSEAYYCELRVKILNSLQTLERNGGAWKKWHWMVGFFNSAIERHHMNVPPIPLRVIASR